MDDGLQTGTRKRHIRDKAGDKAGDNDEMLGISCRVIDHLIIRSNINNQPMYTRYRAGKSQRCTNEIPRESWLKSLSLGPHGISEIKFPTRLSTHTNVSALYI